MEISNIDDLDNENIIKTQILGLMELFNFAKKNQFPNLNKNYKELLKECVEKNLISENSIEIYDKYFVKKKSKKPKKLSRKIIRKITNKNTGKLTKKNV